jgi:hypothetical protein
MSLQTNYLAVGDDCLLIADVLLREFKTLYATDEVSEHSGVEWEPILSRDRLGQIVEGFDKYLTWDMGRLAARRHERVSRGFPLDRYSTHLIAVSHAGEYHWGVARMGRVFLYSECADIRARFQRVSRQLRRHSIAIPAYVGARAFPLAKQRCFAIKNLPGGALHQIKWD